jgi:hypothetical protein
MSFNPYAAPAPPPPGGPGPAYLGYGGGPERDQIGEGGAPGAGWDGRFRNFVGVVVVVSMARLLIGGMGSPWC